MAAIPYLALAAAAGLLLLVGSRLGPRPVWVGIMLVTGMFSSLIDLPVASVARLYEYKPGLLPGLNDLYLGVFIAECLFVPALYGLLAAVPSRYRLAASPLVTLLFEGVEVLFIHLGVFEHHGWRYLYSVLCFTLYGAIAVLWANAFEKRGYRGPHRIILLCAAVHYVGTVWGLLGMQTLNLYSVHMGWMALPDADNGLSALVLEGGPLFVLACAAVYFRWYQSFWGVLGIVAVLAAWLAFLQQRHIWIAHSFWNIGFQAVVAGLIILVCGRIDRWFEQKA